MRCALNFRPCQRSPHRLLPSDVRTLQHLKSIFPTTIGVRFIAFDLWRVAPHQHSVISDLSVYTGTLEKVDVTFVEKCPAEIQPAPHDVRKKALVQTRGWRAMMKIPE